MKGIENQLNKGDVGYQIKYFVSNILNNAKNDNSNEEKVLFFSTKDRSDHIAEPIIKNFDQYFFGNGEELEYSVPEEGMQQEKKDDPNKEENIILKRYKYDYPEDYLKKKKVNDLKKIVENISYEYKLKFHWSWLQHKSNLIQLIKEPNNPKFKNWNPNV